MAALWLHGLRDSKSTIGIAHLRAARVANLWRAQGVRTRGRERVSARRRLARRGSAASLAGWLFADSLLVLMLVGLGTQVPQSTAGPVPAVPATATASPPPCPSCPSKPAPLGLQSEPVILTVDVDTQRLLSGSHDELARVQSEVQRLAKDRLGGKGAAIALIWGYSSDSKRGRRISSRVAEVLTEATDSSFATVTNRPYWHDASEEGRVDIELFVFNR